MAFCKRVGENKKNTFYRLIFLGCLIMMYMLLVYCNKANDTLPVDTLFISLISQTSSQNSFTFQINVSPPPPSPIRCVFVSRPLEEMLSSGLLHTPTCDRRRTVSISSSGGMSNQVDTDRATDRGQLTVTIYATRVNQWPSWKPTLCSLFRFEKYREAY